jgi:hypothetical protein
VFDLDRGIGLESPRFFKVSLRISRVSPTPERSTTPTATTRSAHMEMEMRDYRPTERLRVADAARNGGRGRRSLVMAIPSENLENNVTANGERRKNGMRNLGHNG